MKNRFVLLLLLWSANVICQEYNPLIGDSNEWYVLQTFEGSFTEKYFLGKDSIIDSYIYKPLHQNENTTYQDFFLREDVLERKVYALTRFNTEIIYLDFSLNENDSIELTGLDNRNLGWFFVDSVRQINTYAGLTKAIYLSGKPFLNSPPHFPVWVEGIGSLGNPLYFAYTNNEYNFGELSCAFKNGIKLYESEKAKSYETCEIFLDVPKISVVNNFNIYPNPSTSKVFIEYSKIPEIIYAYKVYNSLGGICREGIINEKREELIISTPGIYYIAITDEDRILASSIIVIGLN